MSWLDDLAAWLSTTFTSAPTPPPSPAGGPVSASQAPAGASQPLRGAGASKGKASTGSSSTKHPAKKAGSKFSAPKDATSRTVEASEIPIRNLAIQKLLENARKAEKNYDMLKDRQGAGGFFRMAWGAFEDLSAVVNDPVAGTIRVAQKESERPQVDVRNSKKLLDLRARNNLNEYRKVLKAVYWEEHEKNVKQAYTYTVPAWHTVTKSEHRGEEYVWNHIVIVGPGFFASA